MDNFNINFEKGYNLEEALNDIANSDNESDCDSILGSEGSDGEVDVTEEDIQVEDEIDVDSCDADDTDNVPVTQILTSRNGQLTYDTQPPPQRKQPSRNIVRQAGNIPQHVRLSLETRSDCFFLFITDHMLNTIVMHTNNRAVDMKDKYICLQRWRELDSTELRAFFGLLITAGVHKARGKPLDEFWSKENGLPIFRATMSYSRFTSILMCLRFDDKQTREVRKAASGSKAEAIRAVFEMFVDACMSCYVPGPYITVDEHLCVFRGRCPIKVYIPSKPGKYGIKVWAAVDRETNFLINAQIYTGKSPEGRELNQGKRVVHDMVDHLRGSGRNVTTDNFFTSFELGQELLKKKLTLVGTLRANRKEIPKEMLPSKERTLLSTKFAYTQNTLLASYVPKKNKSVILLSTLHNSFDVSEREDKKPEVILFYNSTKSGVDTVDQMARHYSVKRSTRRWPLALFFDVLDLACLNAFTLYCKFLHNLKGKKVRRSFMLELGKELVNPHIQRRILLPQCRSRSIISSVVASGFKDILPDIQAEVQSSKRKRCDSCPRSMDRKVNQRCESCNKFVCKEHARVTVRCVTCPTQSDSE